MTQTSENIRFRIVDETSGAATDDLATQIYDTYVGPEEEGDGDEAELQSNAPIVSKREETDVAKAVFTVPTLDEGSLQDSHSRSRVLDLPTLPPPQRLATEQSCNGEAGNTTIATDDRASSPEVLTDAETAVLREVLSEKLSEEQIQRLLQRLHREATPPDIHRSQPPLSPRTVNRYRLGALVLLLMLLGIGSSIVLNRPTGKGLVLPNAPTNEATPTATPSVEAIVPPQLDATLASRNVALDAALKESEAQRDALDWTRRDYLLSQADAEMKRNGTPIEVWLIRRLNAQMLELRRALGQGGQFSGTPQQIAIARALVGDARATLLALQEEWQNSNAAPGRNRIAPAILTKQMSELAELARLIRESSYEQQLRDEAQARGSSVAKKLSEPKKREERGHDVLPAP
jgi:hypothetical protein